MKPYFKFILAGVTALQSASYANAYVQEKCAPSTGRSCKTEIYSDDPEKINILKGENIISEVKSASDDKERWALVILFSGSGDDEIQSVDLVKAKKFSMILDPRKGRLTFATASDRQSFKIAKPESGPDELCPNYQVRAIQAGDGYAIINKVCPKNEYRPGRIYMSNDYYLFDQRSKTMRAIWSAAIVTPTEKFPKPQPEIHIAPTYQGYHFKWTGMFPGDGFSRKVSIANIYKIESDQRGMTKLVCYDASVRKNPVIEGDMCRGDVLDHITEASNKKLK